jgi:hypothetical protein
MMKLQRDWVTPLMMGAFLLAASTGALMFFHLDSVLNKTAHEWLSWALLGGVGLHAVVNRPAFRRHLTSRSGRALVAGYPADDATTSVAQRVGGDTRARRSACWPP